MSIEQALLHRHYFLSDENCIQRLVDDYNKNGAIWIAYDFDNTVFDYHGQGHDYSEIINLLKDLKTSKIGCGFIVWTAADDMDFVKKFLDEHKLPYDFINENPPFFQKKNPRKIYANILLDDRAGLWSAYHQLVEFKKIIEKQKN